jgi:hypothetical protein
VYSLSEFVLEFHVPVTEAESENFFRKGYHPTTDTSKKMDWDYASDIGKVAIQTAATMAGKSTR